MASESHYFAEFPPISLAASSKSSGLAPTFLLNLCNLKLPTAKSLGHFSSPSSLNSWWSHPVLWLSTFLDNSLVHISNLNISLLAFPPHLHFYVKPNIKPETFVLKTWNVKPESLMSCHPPSIVSPLAAPLQFMVTSFTHLYWYQSHPHPLSVVYKQLLLALPSRYTLNPITSLQIPTSTILSNGPLSPSFLDFCNGLLNGLSVFIPFCMLSILPSEIGDPSKINQMMSLLALHSPVGLVLLRATPTSDHDLEGHQPTSPALPPTPHLLTHKAQPHWPSLNSPNTLRIRAFICDASPFCTARLPPLLHSDLCFNLTSSLTTF